MDFTFFLHWLEQRDEDWANFKNFAKSHMRPLCTYGLIIKQTTGINVTKDPIRKINEPVLVALLTNVWNNSRHFSVGEIKTEWRRLSDDVREAW